MVVDRFAPTPLYWQIAESIRTRIESGELAPGRRLPAELDFVEEHGVSRVTVARAMAVLRKEGLIVTDRSGSRVRPPASRASVTLDRGTVGARMPTDAERRKLGIGEGVPLIVVERGGQDPEIYPADRALIEVGTG
jgi:GntR family transcriptional regulator